jgi:predicted RNase H-like HicB family nuclease
MSKAGKRPLVVARYLFKTEPDDNGTLLITCPAFPEVTTNGEDTTQVLANARAAVERPSPHASA